MSDDCRDEMCGTLAALSTCGYDGVKGAALLCLLFALGAKDEKKALPI